MATKDAILRTDRFEGIFITVLKAMAKSAIFAVAVVFYFANVIPLYPLYKLNPKRMRSVLIRIIGFYARFCLWFMRIEPTWKDPKGLMDGEENFLIVSNHLSYTDVLAICAKRPSCFVTSVEIREVPFLGQICELGGCLFVERRNKSNLSNEIKELTNALKEGLDVTIFPEATSTDGSSVLRFRRPLYKSAMDSGKKVLPLTVNYIGIVTHEGEKGISLENRDQVCWYGDMTFPDHLWGIFKMKRLKLEISVGEAINSNVEEHGILAEKSHQIVLNAYHPIS